MNNKFFYKGTQQVFTKFEAIFAQDDSQKERSEVKKTWNEEIFVFLKKKEEFICVSILRRITGGHDNYRNVLHDYQFYHFLF